MKTIIWLAVVSCLLLAAFLWFRPVVGELGRPTVPDATGRARRAVADGVARAPVGGPTPGTTPTPTPGGPSSAGISHPEALEAKILELTNVERAKKGESPLQPEPMLTEVARGHSDDMLMRGFFDHVNPDGLADSDRVAIHHRRLIGVTGENIWMRYGSDAPDLNKMAAEIMYGEQGWMNSPGHRANILRPEYTHLGVGASVRGGELRATQNFAVVRAYTERPVPAQVSAGTSLDLASTPLNGGATPDRYDYWISKRGINTGESYPLADGAVRPASGVYKLRFYFPKDGGEAAYSIYDGPQIEVK